jgi:hypothetical protein
VATTLIREVAPERVVLKVCPVCGRTDRHVGLSLAAGKHYVLGKRCRGVPVEVEYVRAD